MLSLFESVLSVCLFGLITTHSGSAIPPCLNEDCHQSPRNTRQVKTLSMKMCETYGETVFGKVYGIDGQHVTVDQCGHKRQKRIINGTIVRPRTFPHMAILTNSDLGESVLPLCGGSLISDKFILTAAHCNSSKPPLKYAILGDLGYNLTIDDARPVWKEIKEIILHPDYDRRYHYNDIALIELKETVEFNAFIRPICISSDQNIPKSATIAGWGFNTEENGVKLPEVLHEGTVEIVPISKCREDYNLTNIFPIPLLSSTHMCALGSTVDVALGDSGGPLQVRLEQPYCMDKQIGIISVKRINGNFPTVYTRVAQYVPWIESIVWADEYLFGFKTKVENMILTKG